MKFNINSRQDASPFRAGPKALVLRAPVDVILETLPRFGVSRFVAGGEAVRVEQTATGLAVVPGGALIVLSDTAEIWPNLDCWDLALAVAESDRCWSALSFRFFDGDDQRIIEVHVSAQGRALERARTCIARWHAPWSLAPDFAPRPPALPSTEACHTDAATEARQTAFQRGLRRARRWGCDATVRVLETRHQRSRLEVLSLIGAPWVAVVPRFDLFDLFDGIARQELDTRLIVANAGATYVCRRRLPGPRHAAGALRLRDTDVDIAIDETRVAHLRTVRLRAHGRDVTALEAFDQQGAPAFSIVGARDATGQQAGAWTAFADEIRRMGQRGDVLS
jgi:putative heme degradation protein